MTLNINYEQLIKDSLKIAIKELLKSVSKKDQEGCLAFKWAMMHFFYLIFFLQLRYFVFIISRTISRLLQILK